MLRSGFKVLVLILAALCAARAQPVTSAGGDPAVSLRAGGDPAPSPRAGGGPALSETALWLQSYLRLDTTNPPGHEELGAAFLAGVLRSAGIESRILTSTTGRASLYARLQGSGPGSIILLHHIDVVRQGAAWTLQPFSGAIVGGALVGRGALDVKSLGIAELSAFIDLKRKGVTPRRSIIFLAVADEETGGGEGSAFVLAKYPELFAGAELVLNEGGSNRVVAGDVRWWGVEVAQKRPLWLRVRATGRGGHAAGLQPHSAAHELIEALARLLAMPPSYHVSEPARRYLAALGPLHGGALGDTMAHIDRAVTPQGPREAMLPGMASLFLDTVQVTVLHASEQINTVASEASAEIDIRLLPDTDADAFLDRVKIALGTEVETELLLGSPLGSSSPSDSADWKTLVTALGPAPTVPAFIAGFTDSRYFRGRGIAAYGISPFALAGDELAGIHGPDERIPLAELERGTERMRRLLQALAH